jgi:hypothetical protein
MTIRKIGFLATCATVAAFGITTTANAQATRTWVSGVGDDVNPCSRTAPCKTFAGAISKTAAGGEINCLDPGGFGAVTITKSMTISCPYTEGGALAGGNGIVVNMPAATDVAIIRGLDIFGVNPPIHGIRFINQGTLHVEDSVIRRFNAVNSNGISFQPSGPAELYISNTTITENGNAGGGGGIEIKPTGVSGSAKVTMRDVRVRNNASHALRIDTIGNTSTAGVFVTIDDSEFSGSTNGIVLNTDVGTNPARMMLNGSTVASNSGTGILVGGASSTGRVGNTSIHGNGVGVTFGTGGTLNTYGDNRLDGNNADGAFTLPAIPKR